MSFKHFAAFLIGACMGSMTTWYYTKSKYEQIAQEEIDSVKKVFAPQNDDDADNKSDKKTFEDGVKEGIEYAKIIKEQNYTDYSDISNTKTVKKANEKEKTESMDKPYVIAPEEYGEFEEYETISLTYYSDGVLTDENDEVVDDIENVVGLDALNHFGEYEDDSVFVRNDRLKSDYEIIADSRTYSEILLNKPYLMGD